MSGTVDIKVGTRSLFKYLTKPITRDDSATLSNIQTDSMFSYLTSRITTVRINLRDK
jgi:hypothetical protein